MSDTITLNGVTYMRAPNEIEVCGIRYVRKKETRPTATGAARVRWLDLVRENPGCTAAELCAIVGKNSSQGQPLYRAERRGALVVRRGEDGVKRFYLPGSDDKEAAE